MCSRAEVRDKVRGEYKMSSRAGVREKVRGEYRVSSLVKQNKKAKICFVIYIAGKKKLLFYIYAVIVKQNFYKRATNYYSCEGTRRN